MVLGHALCRADGARGADETAEVATHALDTHNMGTAVGIEGDGLVSAIGARDETTPAADAARAVNLGEDHRLAVEVYGGYERGQFLADELLHAREPARGYIVVSLR